jgi:hypothetical protein
VKKGLLTVTACLAVGFIVVPGVSAKVRTIRANPSSYWAVTRLGDWKVNHDPGYPAAVAHLGQPSSIDNPGSASCKGHWKKLGLTIQFENFGGGSTCRDGFAQKASIKHSAGRHHWRTERGLRIGDTAHRLHNLYPAARKHGPNWWVVFIKDNPIGTGGPSPIVSAKLHHHHVTRFGLWLGGAGD